MDSRKNLYGTIAENIKKERKRLSISQVQLAEKADVSVDTIKSVENSRRAMSLDTYLNIVQALGMEPLSLMGWGKTGEYTERFSFLVERRSQGEIEFVLHMVEQMLRGHDSYLKE